MVRAAAAAIAAAGALAGCTLITDSFLTNDFSGDPFPTQVDATSGALLVGMQPLDGSAPRTAVLDLLSPITLRDQAPEDDPRADPMLSTVDVMLLGKDSAGMLDLPRARFPQAQLITLHPCASVNEDDPGQPPGCTVPDPPHRPTCAVGTPADLRPFAGVIGADALAGDAIRLRLADQEVFVLGDIGGSDRGRTLSCEAVFSSPYRGGGTLLISGTELPFGNRRLTLSACLGQGVDPDPTAITADPAPFSQHGADALFVVSTGIGISILGEAAYERYRTATPSAPGLAQLPLDTVCLPSGPITGRRATLDQIALVGPSISNGLSPCRHVYAHRMLSAGPVARNSDPNLSCGDVSGIYSGCPCKDGSSFCAVPAVVELTPTVKIDVLVVSDTEPTLQALRAELRPDQPELDGILGTNVLRGAELDVDYPHDRLIARCAQPGGGECRIRPQLTEAGDRCQINRCIYGATVTVGCPMPAP